MIPYTYIFILYAAVFIGVVILYYNVVKQKKEKTNVMSEGEREYLDELLNTDYRKN